MSLRANSLWSAALGKRFLLVDRDGTLIVEKHYLCDPEGVEIFPGVAEALKSFNEAGWGIAIVTNQAGVGRGYYSIAQMNSVNDRVRDLLSVTGVVIDGFFACPHAPSEDCDCRKPKPGLIHQAVALFNFDPAESVVVGDKACDINLGKSVSALTVLVRTGYGKEEEASANLSPDFVVDSLSVLRPSDFAPVI